MNVDLRLALIRSVLILWLRLRISVILGVGHLLLLLLLEVILLLVCCISCLTTERKNKRVLGETIFKMVKSKKLA